MKKFLFYLFSNKKIKKQIRLGRVRIVPCQVCGKIGYDTGWCCPKCGWVQDLSLSDDNDEFGLNNMSIKEYKEYYENRKKIRK